MHGVVCADPAFEWVAERGWWSACTNCGRLAWDHEQADPLADMRDVLAGSNTPPNMRTSGTY